MMWSIQIRRGRDRNRLSTFLGRRVNILAPIDVQASFGAAHLYGSPGDSRRERRIEGGGVVARILQKNVNGVRSRPAIAVIVNTACSGCRLRYIVAHEHVDDVDPVREQVRDLPAAEIEVRAPVPVLLRIPVAPRQGTEVMRPVQIAGLLLQ